MAPSSSPRKSDRTAVPVDGRETDLPDEASAGDLQPTPEDRYFVGALARGLQVLRCFDRDTPTLSLAEVAEKVGWARNVPFRYLHTLERLGYLRRDPTTRRYSVTLRVLEFGFQALSQLGWRDLAQPYLEQLRDLTAASSHLGVLDGGDVVYVARAASRLVLSSTIQVGSRLPAQATAMGKVLLAAMSPEEISDWLRHASFSRYTANTLSQSRLLEELLVTRARGYAVSNGEFEAGIRSVAAPVLGADGVVIAAINVSGPATVLKDEELTGTVLQAVLATARELSKVSRWWEPDVDRLAPTSSAVAWPNRQSVADPSGGGMPSPMGRLPR